MINLPLLNLPEFDFKISKFGNDYKIYDIIRKAYYVLTPEEWVRQHFVRYLIDIFNYPIGRIAVEKKIMVNKLSKRFDVVIYSKSMKPLILIECKSPSIDISQDTFSQAGIYNIELKAKYIIITNGIKHFIAEIDFVERKYRFLKSIPKYDEA